MTESQWRMVPLRIAIAGTGKMGQAVQESAQQRGHLIVKRFNSKDPVSETSLPENADVVIDFTQPELAITHMTHYCKTKMPAVIGTTGWYDHLNEVQDLFETYQSVAIYGSNFSLGIQLLLQALNSIGPLLDQLPEFDTAIHEVHHSGKADSPSGTAITLAHALLNGLQRKRRWSEASVIRDPSTLEVRAMRLGHVFGQHRVIIDGPADHIILEHTAKNRNGFAVGAVRAAEWIQGRRGLFTVEDMLAYWLSDHSIS